MSESTTAAPRERRLQIRVTHTTHQQTFYEVPLGQGWRIDPAMRCIVVGRGVPRTLVPLDTVLCFDLEWVD